MTQDRSCLIVRTTRLRPHIRLVTVGGEIDLATTPDLAAALTGVADPVTPGEAVIDLGAVTFLGACGVGVLAEARGRASAAGTPVWIAAERGTVAARSLACCGWADDGPGRGVVSAADGPGWAFAEEMRQERARVTASLDHLTLGPHRRCGVCAVRTAGRRLRISAPAVRCHDHLVSPA
ncbi:STAS domain-containing protein [Pseudonocardia sediminis]|nr:STAS domain-containing protein [Pseudonocardia sediminis]